MPRPKHYAEREAAFADGVKTGEIKENSDEPSSAGLDEPANSNQSSKRTGLVLPKEGDETVFEPVARSMGWVPKDEWTRHPSEWTDARTFLEDQPRRLSDMKARIRTLGQVTERQLEEERRAIREEAEREIREAAKAQDPERAVKAGEKLAQVAGPPPETRAWLARNAWFDADPAAQALARTIVDRKAAEGMTHAEQLEAAEREVRKRFPEHFPDARREEGREEGAKDIRGESRLSDIARRDPPSVAEGQRGSSNRRSTREPGWSDIPSLDREAMKPFFKRFRSRGWDDAKIQSELAGTYWATKNG